MKEIDPNKPWVKAATEDFGGFLDWVSEHYEEQPPEDQQEIRELLEWAGVWPISTDVDPDQEE